MRWPAAVAAVVLLLGLCTRPANAAAQGCFFYEGHERGRMIGESCICDVGFYSPLCDIVYSSGCNQDPLSATALDGSDFRLTTRVLEYSGEFEVTFNVSYAPRRRVTLLALSSPSCGFPIGTPTYTLRFIDVCADNFVLSIPLSVLETSGTCQQTVDGTSITGDILFEVEEYLDVSLRGYTPPPRVYSGRVPFRIDKAVNVTATATATLFAPVIVEAVLTDMTTYDDLVEITIETIVQDPYVLSHQGEGLLLPVAPGWINTYPGGCIQDSSLPGRCRQQVTLAMGLAGLESVDGQYQMAFSLWCREVPDTVCQDEGSLLLVDFEVSMGQLTSSYQLVSSPTLTLTTDKAMYTEDDELVSVEISYGSQIPLISLQFVSIVAFVGQQPAIEIVGSELPPEGSGIVIAPGGDPDSIIVSFPLTLLGDPGDGMFSTVIKATFQVAYGQGVPARRRSADGAKPMVGSTTFAVRR